MHKDTVTIYFEEDSSPVDSLEISKNTYLSDLLDATNSPLLFGCRTGICGTCVILVESDEKLPEISANEKEFFESIGVPLSPNLRLACQTRLNQSVKIKKTKV